MFTATIRSTVSVLWTPSQAAVQEFPLDGKGIPIPTITYLLERMREEIEYRAEIAQDVQHPHLAVFDDPRMCLIFSSHRHTSGLAYLFDLGKTQRVPDSIIGQNKEAFRAWNGEPFFAIDPFLDLTAECRKLNQFRTTHMNRLRGQTKVETL